MAKQPFREMDDMKNGLAIWHYPHRTVCENARYFAEKGFDCVSILGFHMIEVCEDAEEAAKPAQILKQTGAILTVHHKLPRSHAEEHVSFYKHSIDLFGAWQKEYGLISILSFDVSDSIRDNVKSYIDYALSEVPDAKIALEDFGLNERECEQIEYLKSEPRFGYLLDMGHMNIRMHGRDKKGYTLFTTSALEGGLVPEPKAADFLRAYRSKEFPVFEMHLHNNDGEKDLHEFLEDGVIDMRELAQAVRDFGYDGIMTIESVPGDRYEGRRAESDERIMQTFAYWQEVYSQTK